MKIPCRKKKRTNELIYFLVGNKNKLVETHLVPSHGQENVMIFNYHIQACENFIQVKLLAITSAWVI